MRLPSSRLRNRPSSFSPFTLISSLQPPQIGLPYGVHPNNGRFVIAAREAAPCEPQWALRLSRIFPIRQDCLGPRSWRCRETYLRARRFPEDALDYYNYALSIAEETEIPMLMNKIGVTQLDLRHNGVFARDVTFQRRAVKDSRRTIVRPGTIWARWSIMDGAVFGTLRSVIT